MYYKLDIHVRISAMKGASSMFEPSLRKATLLTNYAENSEISNKSLNPPSRGQRC